MSRRADHPAGTRQAVARAARVRALLAQTARAVRIVVGHGRIPRPLRWLAALGLLPVPGPFDEAVLLVVALILLLFYRQQLREAWREAGVATSRRGRAA